MINIITFGILLLSLKYKLVKAALLTSTGIITYNLSFNIIKDAAVKMIYTIK